MVGSGWLDRETREWRTEKLRRLADVKSWLPFMRFAPPGHFYSPIPSLPEIHRDTGRLYGAAPDSIPGVDLRADEQLATWQQLARLVDPGELSHRPTPGRRYYSDNTMFSFADAFALAGMVRLLQPRLVIEIGSGYSSAVVLDATDEVRSGPHLTMVEPFPARLQAILRPADESRTTVIERRVQDVPLDVFAELADGDLLFIDSSHVVKTGGDVNYLLGEVVPRLGSGVTVHVHDIFYPFEVPEEWVNEGRAWAETYLLKAFLQFNSAFDIVLFMNWLQQAHPTVLEAVDPRLARYAGSIYFRRR